MGGKRVPVSRKRVLFEVKSERKVAADEGMDRQQRESKRTNGRLIYSRSRENKPSKKQGVEEH